MPDEAPNLNSPSEYPFPYLYAALRGKTGYQITSLALGIYAVYILIKITKKDKKISNSFVVLGFTTIIWIIVSLTFSVDIFTFWRYVSGANKVNPDTLFSAAGLSRSELGQTFYTISWYMDILSLGRSTIILQNQKFQRVKLYSNVLCLIFLVSEALGFARLYYPGANSSQAILMGLLFTTALVKITGAMIIFGGQNLYRHEGQLKIVPCYSTPLAAVVVTLIECIYAIFSLDLLFMVLFTLPDSILGVLPLKAVFHFQGIAMLCAIMRVIRSASLAVLFPYHPTPVEDHNNSDNDTKSLVIATVSDEKLREIV
jgi:hypothetical protein